MSCGIFSTRYAGTFFHNCGSRYTLPAVKRTMPSSSLEVLPERLHVLSSTALSLLSLSSLSSVLRELYMLEVYTGERGSATDGRNEISSGPAGVHFPMCKEKHFQEMQLMSPLRGLTYTLILILANDTFCASVKLL